VDHNYLKTPYCLWVPESTPETPPRSSPNALACALSFNCQTLTQKTAQAQPCEHIGINQHP